MEKIEGYIEQIIYKNEENGYMVFEMVFEGDEITCVGYMGQANEGEYLEADADIIHHHTYGEQYKIQNYVLTVPQNIIAMERYLGSGLIKGIGPSLAKKIVKRFNMDTFRIIEDEPERLAEIKGISNKKAQDIALIFAEKREARQAMIFMQEYGISNTYATKIIKKYKDNLYNILKTNPYKLAEDISGIGFQMVDSIAKKIGITSTSVFRLQSGIEYILTKSTVEGHVYLPKDILLEKAIKLLGVDEDSIENVLIDMQINKKIMQKNIDKIIAVYSTSYYYMELSVARKLLDLNMHYDVMDDNFYKEVEKIEKEEDIILDVIQKEAVKQAAKNGVFIVTGGPGTGKTTTINTIIKYFEENGLDITLAAPTGRAAKRMTETTGYEAKTIHRLLEISYNSDADEKNNSKLVFEKNEDNPIESDVVIVDEMSMVDINIMHYLLKAIMPGTRLIMVGDVDQLPSVGPGNVLKDMILSNKLKVTKLTRVFRQASESAIVTNAHKINAGEKITLKNKSKDFFYIKRFAVDLVTEEIRTLIKERLPKYTGYNAFTGLQILTPMRKGLLGIEELNKVIQNIVNPKVKNKQEKVFRDTVFREGDKIMQTKNNYQLVWEIKNKHGYVIEEGTGVFNGDTGIIKKINTYSEKIIVSYEDGKIVEYNYNQLEEIELAYAVTIHKSQGSEYPVVILPILSGPTMLLNRNLLYTAVTRAREYVVLIGNDKVINEMIENEKEHNRFTSLRLRLEEIFEESYIS